MGLGKMAEFVIEKVSKNGARMAHLTLRNNVTTAELCSIYATPAFVIHTLGGSVPHVSAEVLEYIFPTTSSGDEQPRPPLQISVDSTLTTSESVGNFGKGIAKFVGLHDSPVLLTVHNPLNPLRTGYNDKHGIAVWSRHGRKTVSPSGFDKIVKDYKPTIFQGLSDYDVSTDSSIKRVKKSTARALEYLDDITKKGEQQGLFITIESAWFSVDESEAFKTVTKMLEKLDQIDGFVVSFAATPTTISKDDANAEVTSDGKNINYQLLETILSKLPQDKPRFVPGAFRLEQIVELVARGVDLFDSSFVTKLADSGDVLMLDRLEELLPKRKCAGVNEGLPVRNGEDSLPVADAEKETKASLLSLKEKRFVDDFSPISANCSCYTCRKHTRSYINHLYCTEELLGPVLVMIHNLTAFSRFFEAIRYQLKSEEIDGSIGIDEVVLAKIKQCL